ncbi:TldD/PmbA family protein [Tumebacillus sp. DT12]|uniref:TldD/PmbA family protein n=1 Tax=Tumebacillus lacus TaxID=2995335 RepID=A0ABT3X2R4_9BACL|nr:TldD/PmbA family protein [Tumebacillus lacus]MCX7569014.1 TldD/PmbA family protein [Tumebacillus lacus]
MDLQQFRTELFARGRELGYADMEVYYQADKSTSVRVFKGEIDSYTVAEKAGLSFRGSIGGKMGYSFTERLDESSIEFLLTEARANAELLQGGEIEELFGGSDQYPELDLYAPELAKLDPSVLIEAAKEMERTALAVDPRVDLINYCMVTNSEAEVSIINTQGLDCTVKSSLVYGGLSAVAKDGEEVTSALDSGFVTDDLARLDFTGIATRAAKESVAKLGAQPVESGQYPVILRNNVAAQLLNAFSEVFSGEAAEKGLSKLQGRVGDQVAGANITLVDDALLPGGPGSVPFDSEGTATARLEVIREGQLVTMLHNRKSAKKAGVSSTGNAVKGSYKSTVSIAPNNFVLQPGTKSLDELIAGTERGLMLVELQGIHAGTNPVSGDFSLSCLGFLIEGGQVARPVNQITVSGNFFDLLQSVEELGNDLRFHAPGRGACGAPSIKIAALSIAGK